MFYPLLIDLIEQSIPPDALHPSATEEMIRDAEEALGVSFPTSYRWFLQNYGAIDHLFDVYGLSEKEIPKWLHVVHATLDERHTFEPHIPAHFVAVSPDGAGNHYCIDTSQMENGEAPIVFWNHESDNAEITVTHETFAEMLAEFCRDVIEDDAE